jgi:hypothetical protein
LLNPPHHGLGQGLLIVGECNVGNIIRKML